MPNTKLTYSHITNLANALFAERERENASHIKKQSNLHQQYRKSSYQKSIYIVLTRKLII